jgi:hypothetical protein
VLGRGEKWNNLPQTHSFPTGWIVSYTNHIIIQIILTFLSQLLKIYSHIRVASSLTMTNWGTDTFLLHTFTAKVFTVLWITPPSTSFR